MSDDRHRTEAESPALIGDFYDGAYGPTIILIASTPNACAWLQEVFRDLARGGPSRTLTTEAEVQFTNVEAIEMSCRRDGPRVSLGHRNGSDGRFFVWSATSAGWLYLAALVQPLADGETGHQYLTDSEDDVALIELSCGEHDVISALGR